MKLRKTLLPFATAVAMLLPAIINAAPDVTELPLVPAPKEISASSGTLPVNKLSAIYAAKQNIDSAKYLQSVFKARYGRTLQIKEFSGGVPAGGIVISSGKGKNPEAYTLDVSSNGVLIKGASPAGAFYGVCTLAQLFISSDGDNAKSVPALKIKDVPRFGYRGLMLDPARTFLPIEDVRKFIVTMASYKFNTLHFHLADDHGWRIELKNPKFKKLNEIGGSKNNPTKNKNGYYTQKELRDLVAFAAKYNVEIIPEIDMPGHSMAVITTFPQLACQSVQELNKKGNEAELAKYPKMKIEIWSHPGVSESLLCAGNPEVYKMYSEILDEVCSIFPSKKFHVGGDEAPTKCWTMCEKCQALMKKKGMTRPQELMSYFFAEMNKILVKNGKLPFYWYELDVPEYPKKAVAYAWRMGLSVGAINRAQKEGYGIVCCPGEHAYLDYPNIKGGTPQPNWGMPATTLEQSYKFDPGYGREPKDQAHILGVEGTLWGEYMKDLDRIYYMAYPRALAVVEAGWTPMSRRSWESFKTRAKPIIIDMHKRDVPAYWPEEVYGKE